MISIFITLLTILIVLVVSLILQRRDDIRQYLEICKALKQFPSPPKHWFFGHLKELTQPNEQCVQMLEKRSTEYKTCFVHWYGLYPFLFCNNADAARSIIKSSAPKGDWSYAWLKTWLGDGLIGVNGNKWGRNRRLLTNAFHFDILKSYVSIHNRCTDVLIQKWNKHADNHASFNLYEDMKLLAFDVILQSAFSLKIDCQTAHERHPYVNAVYQLSYLITERLFRITGYVDWLYRLTESGRRYYRLCKFVHQFTEKIIREKRQLLKENTNQYDSNQKRRLDFIDIILQTRDEDGNCLSDKEINDEINTFMFAGHDTTSSALSWTLYCLAKNPEHQAKVREEADAILNHKDDLEWDDLNNKLAYTLMCIKEAMRLYAVVPNIERKLDDYVEINGKVLPPGTHIVIQLYILARRSEIWPEPDRFNPLRFSEENIQKRDAYDYIPFSAGPRNCIGKNFALEELKIVLAKIIYNYEIELDPARQVTRYYSVISQPTDGIWIKIKRR
ncbi:uncharacterized protein TRIADDRAFT_60697 [Trichoplax adhaerens]|uniref:Cytochrome P450 n=1 Tax=Trichoplax adhaerens TaxID=10228 RepID=B3S948_TRIAD|nr:hypothetical protein TRIADDRAFT_60697 [Trichoplax adhaerens]EDV20811.1 hypothetical protein TRIADDRAFT_60697 [Trichoplax adhaerens]|eukprot:XP_002116752.1 hypothetical protein TRIADDRAFT_60697 [Trichoplax adhaerens]